MEIGKKMRELREQKSFTVKHLSQLVECTPSLISQLERGKADPSISTLKKIAKALNANIVDFFMPDEARDDIVTKVHERVDMQLARWDARIQSLIKAVGKKRMQPFYTVIRPGGGSHGMYSHDGEEFGIVLQGTLQLAIEDKVLEVRKDETFYFSSQKPHDWGNTGREEVVVIWVITPPTF